MVAPTILNFNRAAKQHYIDQLTQSMDKLSSELYKSNVVRTNVASYYETYTNIIKIYGIEAYAENISDLCVSNISGFPMYSRIIELVNTQKKSFANMVQLRKEEDISRDAIESLYTNNQSAFEVFISEYCRKNYLSKLSELVAFKDITKLVEEKNTDERMVRYSFDYAAYPLSEMSCVTVSLDASMIKSIKPFASKPKLPLDKIKKYATEDVRTLYEILKDHKAYPAVIEKTQPFFNFYGRDIKDPLIRKIIFDHPQSTILQLKFSKIENIDVLLAENIFQLKRSIDEIPVWSTNSIYVCPLEIKDLLEDGLMEQFEQGTRGRPEPFKIITYKKAFGPNAAVQESDGKELDVKEPGNTIHKIILGGGP